MSLQDLQAIVDDMQEAAMALTRTYDGIPARLRCPTCHDGQVFVRTYEDVEGRVHDAPDDAMTPCPRCRGTQEILRSDEVG